MELYYIAGEKVTAFIVLLPKNFGFKIMQQITVNQIMNDSLSF